MSSIPLPALAIQTPQQPDIMGQAAKMMSLKSLLGQQQLQQENITAVGQENQQRDQQLKDTKVVRDAFVKNNGDIDKTIKDAGMNGASPEALLKLQQHGLDVKSKALDLYTKQGDLAIKHANLAQGAHDTVTKAAPQDRPAVYQQQLQGLAAAGVDTSQMPQQYPGDDQFKLLGAVVQGHSQQMEEAKTIAATAKDTAEAGAATATTAKTNLEVQNNAVPGMADAKYVSLVQRQKMGMPLAPADQAWLSAYQKQKTLVPTANFNLQNAGATGTGGKPSIVAQSLADGSMKWENIISNKTPMAIKQQLLAEVKQINPNFNSGDFSIEQAVKKDFTSGDAAKNLTAFNTAIEHSKQLQSAADAMKNGDMPALNKIGNALGYQFGSDKTTNFNVIKNALTGEISKVFKGGQATDAEIHAVQEPFNAANSPEQLKGAINNAIALMNSKRDALKQQYDAGKQAKPNFGDGNQGGKIRARDPQGKLHEAPAGTTLPAGWKAE